MGLTRKEKTQERGGADTRKKDRATEGCLVSKTSSEVRKEMEWGR